MSQSDYPSQVCLKHSIFYAMLSLRSLKALSLSSETDGEPKILRRVLKSFLPQAILSK